MAITLLYTDSAKCKITVLPEAEYIYILKGNKNQQQKIEVIRACSLFALKQVKSVQYTHYITQRLHTRTISQVFFQAS